MSGHNEGALPGLGDEDGEVLDVPEGTTKRRSNVRLGVVVLLLMAAIGIMFGGAVLFMKHRKAQAVAQIGGEDPSKKKNGAVESKSIEALKAEIKRDEGASESPEGNDTYKAGVLKAAAAKAGQGASSGASEAPAERVPTRSERQLADSLLPGGQAPMKPAGTGQGRGPAASPAEADALGRLQAAQGQAQPGPLGAGRGTAYSEDPAAPKGTGIEAQLTATNLASVKAGRLGNLDFLLKKNTVISCAFKTGLDTTHPSFPVCQVTNDVYSANGKTLLIERGATVHGEARIKMEQGQATAFVLWNRIDNPSGTYANLDSPVSDQMGYGGVEAEVNTHFWARYGGALLLSMVSDGLAAVIDRHQGGNNGGSTVQIGNTTGTTRDMASEALKNSINIPPTGRVKPAKVVSIIVARDVSFESLFKIVQ